MLSMRRRERDLLTGLEWEMNFDPKPSILSSHEKVSDYLTRYHCHLPLMVTMEFCHAMTDVKEAPLIKGMYFRPQILALKVPLPLTPFIEVCWGIIRFLPAIVGCMVDSLGF